MSSKSHLSYASRLGNAKTLVNYLNNYEDYEAPKEELNTEELTKIINTIVEVNTSLVEKESEYKKTVEERRELFYKEKEGVLRLLSPIKNYLEAFYGKTDVGVKQVNKSIRKMRGTTPPTLVTNENNEVIGTISNVETTFASKTENLKEIITELSLKTDYNPSNLFIKYGALRLKHLTIENVNTKIDINLANLKAEKQHRKTMFNDLITKCKQIKRFIKVQYGADSIEYIQVKSLVF